MLSQKSLQYTYCLFRLQCIVHMQLNINQQVSAQKLKNFRYVPNPPQIQLKTTALTLSVHYVSNYLKFLMQIR